MFKFKFGLLWTAFVTPVFIICLVVPGEQRGGVDMSPLLFIVLSLFEFIGLFFLISGLKTIIKDKKTKRNGMPCYGVIKDIEETGSYSNNKPEYKAIIYFVNPETFQAEKIEEIIGFDPDKYSINSCILCKYYQGDVNIERIVSENEIPSDVKKAIISFDEKNSIAHDNYF